MTLQSLDIVSRSATTTASPHIRKTTEVAKLIDISKCIGCKACQVACMEWNDLRDQVGNCRGTYDNPADLSASSWTVMRFSEVERSSGKLEWLIRKDGCMHCEHPGCLAACPAPGAIIKYANGIVDFHEENCTGCGYCVIGCPFNIPRLSEKDHKAYKCTLCSDRVAVGQEPACAKVCPTGAIVFGSKEDMIHHAEGRLADLKERGFNKAALYNPVGVGGTHVMYVLPHGDTPELYHNLPKDPQPASIFPIWKGIAKTVLSASFGVAVLAGIAHYLSQGPNEAEEE